MYLSEEHQTRFGVYETCMRNKNDTWALFIEDSVKARKKKIQGFASLSGCFTAYSEGTL